MGNSAITRSGVCTRGPALRSAISAIIVPSTVVPTAGSNARNSVFQATPQRTPPARQFRPHTRSLPMRLKIAPNDPRPTSVKNAPYSALVTGNAMNSTRITEQPNTADAMKRSPLKYPLRATPKAVIMMSARSTTNAPMPMPMPNWWIASSPNWLFSESNAQPLAPIMKALASRPRKPISPPAKNQWLCPRPTGTARPTAASSSPATPNSSHLRPCTNAWSSPVAVSGPPKICGSTLYQAVS